MNRIGVISDIHANINALDAVISDMKMHQVETILCTGDIVGYHTFPEETARIARDANAGSLVMTHILPPMPASILHPLFLGDSKNIFDGPITIAYDGMLFSLLPDTIEIERQWLLR